MSDKFPEKPLSVKRLLVLIDRDANTKLPASVFDYELPVIVEIYGEDQVSVQSEEDAGLGADFDVQAAYDGLRNKYEKFSNELRLIYRSAEDFARAIGSDSSLALDKRGRDVKSSHTVHETAKAAK